MNAFLITLVNLLAASLAGSSVPVINGDSWEQIVSTALVAVVIAGLNLWQHRPDKGEKK